MAEENSLDCNPFGVQLQGKSWGDFKRFNQAPNNRSPHFS